MNKNGYSKIEVLVIVLLLGIVAFITINKTSYAFSIDSTDAIEEVKGLIEFQAQEYAIDNMDSLFAEADTTFINVEILIENGYLVGNDEGLIVNPADTQISYNTNKIKLELNTTDNTVIATFID